MKIKIPQLSGESRSSTQMENVERDDESSPFFSPRPRIMCFHVYSKLFNHITVVCLFIFMEKTQSIHWNSKEIEINIPTAFLAFVPFNLFALHLKGRKNASSIRIEIHLIELLFLLFSVW